MPYAGGLLGSALVADFLKRQVDAAPLGPNEEQRRRVASYFWGEVHNAAGKRMCSRLRFDSDGYAVFEGEVSLQNNGGFASVRTSSLKLGEPGTAAYSLTTWGDGRTYKLNLRTDSGFDGLNYQASFNPENGQWSQIELSVAEFLPTFRGRVVQAAPSL